MAERTGLGNPGQNGFASINEKAVVSRAGWIIGRNGGKIVCRGHTHREFGGHHGPGTAGVEGSGPGGGGGHPAHGIVAAPFRDPGSAAELPQVQREPAAGGFFAAFAVYNLHLTKNLHPTTIVAHFTLVGSIIIFFVMMPSLTTIFE